MTLISLIILERQPFILSACHSELFLVHGRYQNAYLKKLKKNLSLFDWKRRKGYAQEAFKMVATSTSYSCQHQKMPLLFEKRTSCSHRQSCSDN